MVSGFVWLGGVGLGLGDGAELEPPKIPNATPANSASSTIANITLMTLLFLTKLTTPDTKPFKGVFGLDITIMYHLIYLAGYFFVFRQRSEQYFICAHCPRLAHFLRLVNGFLHTAQLLKQGKFFCLERHKSHTS